MATIQYVVNAVDAASATFERIAGSADHLLKELDDIGKKSVAARVRLDGDKEAQLSLDKLDLKMANLAKKTAMGKVGVEGQARAILQIRALEASLDRLDGKHVTATVEVNTRGGLLSRLGGLFGGGGGGAVRAGQGANAGGNALGGALGAIGPYGQAIAIGGAAAVGATVAPAAIPTLLGGGIGGLGLLLTQAKGLKTVMADVVNTLKTAAAPLKGAFGDILKDFDKFIKSQGPGLREMFKASLPFLNVFVKALEQLGKTLLPVITTSLRQMRPYLPLISEGLLAVIQGLADMIKAIGPRGMQAAAMLFVDLCRIMGAALTVLGKAMNFLAVTVQYTVHAIHQEWDDLRHLTNDAFVQIRHFIAASWDATWRDTVGRAQAGVATVVASFRAFRTLIGSVLTALRQVISSAWNTIWANTRNAVTTGIATVVGFFRGLPGRALAALTGLGHSLYAFAHAALNEFLSGLQSVAKGILGWLSGFVGKIVGLVGKLLRLGSPSGVFFDIGKNMMLGLANGIKAHAHKAANAAQSATSGAVGALGGPTSGDARAAMEYARSRLGAYGWGQSQMSPLINLWNQESGWNRFARNPSSGAYGIPQALPPGKMGAAANPPQSSMAAQINWGLGYIKTRPGYGSPAAAWAHEQAFNWYDRGGWLPPGASLAYNATGQPEQVVGPASMTQVVALLAQILRAVQIAPAATSAGTARALNSAARAAMR